MYNKISNHRNFLHNFPTTQIDSGGTIVNVGSIPTDTMIARDSISNAIIGVTSSLAYTLPYAHACMHITSSFSDTLSAGIWTKLTGSGTVIHHSYLFSQAGSNRLIYDGSTYTNGHDNFVVNCGLTFTSSVRTQLDFAFAIDGSVVSESISTVNIGQTGVSLNTTKAVAIHTILMLTSSNYVELFAKSADTTLLSMSSSAMYTIHQM